MLVGNVKNRILVAHEVETKPELFNNIQGCLSTDHLCPVTGGVRPTTNTGYGCVPIQ